MGKNCDPSPRKRGKVEALLNLGTMSEREIAAKIGLSKTAVHTIKRRLSSGLTSSPKREASGRKPIITPRVKRSLILECKKNRKQSSKHLQTFLQSKNIDVSSSCVRRHLISAGYVARRPCKKPLLDAGQRQRRLAWAKEHQSWTSNDWEKVCFSDESSFHIMDDKAQYVRRKSGEQFLPECTVKTVKHPTSIMVWSMISIHGVGRLDVVEGTMNQDKYIEVIKKKVIPDLKRLFPAKDGIFQQDGAPCHTAKRVMKFMADQGVKVLPWAGNSPDMSPIENLWQIVKRRVAQRMPTTKVKLIEALIDVWARDPEIKQMCPTLIRGMPRRVQEVLKSKGGPTRY